MKASEAVRSGRVRVNGRVARKGALVLHAGDTLEIAPDQEALSDTLLSPVDLHFRVLFEDDACMVIDKPSGISVHPAAGIPKDAPTLLHGIAHLFKKRRLPFHQSSVLVHRLDKDTTGCLLIAKHPDDHVVLQRQFADRSVRKQYLALVAGVPVHKEACIDAPIGRHSGDRKKMAVTHAVAHRRDASTSYSTLAVSPHKASALLLCDLHTGRTHQIRVHLTSIGHPVLGDHTYTTASSTSLARDYGIHSLCLHARTLTFLSPHGAKHPCTITCPLPKDFFEALKKSNIPDSSLQSILDRSMHNGRS